jgi:hypothetical protein
MSTAGWYPDPDGTPGRYRFWDGQSWSGATTDDPRTAPPGTGARRAAGSPSGSPTDPNYNPARAAEQPRRRRRGLIIIVAALLLLIIASIGGVIIWRGGDWGRAGSPGSTTSAWDDSSPTALPSTPAPSPRPTPPPGRPSPPPSTAAGRVTCPAGDPSTRAQHPADGRVRGGRLSFPAVADYGEPQPRPRLSWFYDTASQLATTEPGWASSFTVGEVRRAGSFGTPQQAAGHTLQCMITGDGFEGFAGRKDLRNAALTIDGRPAWMIMAEIRVDRADISVDGDRAVVIFVDDGRRDRLSGFVGLVPLGDNGRIARLDAVIKSLRVD